MNIADHEINHLDQTAHPVRDRALIQALEDLLEMRRSVRHLLHEEEMRSAHPYPKGATPTYSDAEFRVLVVKELEGLLL